MTVLTKAQLDTLQAGLDWLYKTRQPEDAIVHPLVGVNAPVVGDRRFGFIVHSYRSAPAITIAVAEPHYVPDGNDQKLTNPLQRGELAALAAHLEQAGHEVSGNWNGYLEHGSVGLVKKAHRSLQAAAHRYMKGCPQHDGSVFCYNDGCPWLHNGASKLRLPEGW